MTLRKRTQLLSQACRVAGGALSGVWEARETPCGVTTSAAERAKRSQLLSQACRVAGGVSRGVWEPEKRLAASLRAGQSVRNEANFPGAEMGGNYWLEKGLGEDA